MWMSRGGAADRLAEIVARRRKGPSAARPDDDDRLAAALGVLLSAGAREPDAFPWVVELCAREPESDVVRSVQRDLARWLNSRDRGDQQAMAEALARPDSHYRFGRALRTPEPRSELASVVATAVLLPWALEETDRRGTTTGRPAFPIAHVALERDEWVLTLAALRDDELGELAYSVLASVPPSRLPARQTNAPARPLGDALSRYRAGEHVAAWQSLRDLGPLGDDAREEARAVAAEMMRTVRANVEAIVDVLARAGYPFEEEPVSDPARVARELRDLIPRIGGRPPVSLEVFWEIVGAVDLCRREDGDDCELDVGGTILFRNPLQVLSPSVAMGCVEPWERRGRQPPWVSLDIAADELHKEWTSGGTGPCIRVPSEHADARVYGEDAIIDFVPYLRRYFAHCGFLGYERRPEDPAYRRLVERLEDRLAPF